MATQGMLTADPTSPVQSLFGPTMGPSSGFFAPSLMNLIRNPQNQNRAQIVWNGPQQSFGGPSQPAYQMPTINPTATQAATGVGSVSNPFANSPFGVDPAALSTILDAYKPLFPGLFEHPSAGAVGATGAQGLQGIAGINGINGINGTNGLNGAQGVQGLTGAAGANGLNGAIGATGAQGIQGLQGLTGAAGANGLNGATGATGAQGLQGVRGLEGLAGTNGLDGVPGSGMFGGATAPLTSGVPQAPAPLPSQQSVPLPSPSPTPAPSVQGQPDPSIMPNIPTGASLGLDGGNLAGIATGGGTGLPQPGSIFSAPQPASLPPLANVQTIDDPATIARILSGGVSPSPKPAVLDNTKPPRVEVPTSLLPIVDNAAAVRGIDSNVGDIGVPLANALTAGIPNGPTPYGAQAGGGMFFGPQDTADLGSQVKGQSDPTDWGAKAGTLGQMIASQLAGAVIPGGSALLNASVAAAPGLWQSINGDQNLTSRPDSSGILNQLFHLSGGLGGAFANLFSGNATDPSTFETQSASKTGSAPLAVGVPTAPTPYTASAPSAADQTGAGGLFGLGSGNLSATFGDPWAVNQPMPGWGGNYSFSQSGPLGGNFDWNSLNYGQSLANLPGGALSSILAFL